MTAQASDAPNSEAEKPRHRRKALQSGFSLLARGEPQIWLIGGMLVVCLAMIISLLTLVLYRGLPSFWPKQVDWLVLSDGTQEIGQPQGRRTGDANQMVLQDASDDDAAEGDSADSEDDGSEANEPVADADSTDGEDTYSTYYRTGNYRLSQVHYRWMDSTLLQEGSISTPPWAAVVERLEWGRFYGIPLLATEQIGFGDPSIDQIDELKEALESANQAADGETISNALTQLDAVRTDLQQAATRASALKAAENLEENQAVQVAASLSGPWQQVSAADLRQDAAEESAEEDAADADEGDSGGGDGDSRQTLLDGFSVARVVHHGRENSTRWLQRAIPAVIDARRELEHLRYQVSRMDLRISELRVDIRRAELSTDARSSQQPDAIHFQLEERVRVEEQLERLSEYLDSGDKDLEVEGLQDAVELAVEEALPSRLESLNNEVDQWLQLSAEAEKPIQDALSSYCDGYSEVFQQKQPLQERIEELEEELTRIGVAFAVPNGSSVLDATLTSVADEVATGEVGQDSLDALKAAGIAVVDDSVSITVVSDSLAMLDALDESGQAISISSTLAVGATARNLVSNTVETIPAEQIVRLVSVNQLSFGQKWSVYLDRWKEFLTENPREANSEGGVFPVIWGTIVMTLLMTIAVVPFGVMAALYLREYAGAGPLVSIIRISINNLAGVPSIVYGVFGFSFFCYTIGAYVDGGPKNADINPWPPNIWFVFLAVTACTGTAAFFFSFFYTGSPQQTPKTKRLISRFCLGLWLVSIGLFAALILKSPFFDGFYQAYLPNPTFGKGGLLWGALTLALLTLPVVIVATEEALAAVPNSLREGSLACGASKWQTIRRIILPHARPGILTGAILAMARGAGEVAPLMLVGALPSAPDLPVDTEFPFFHLSRSFMHLGYQIYVMGFQSQNSDAAVPLVFTCTLLLITIVAVLNLVAILLRSRLKRRFQGNQF